LVLRPKPRNRRGDLETQITKPSTLVLRPKPRNCHSGFEAKPLPVVLRLNQETHASRLLHVYDVDCTRHHPTSRSSSHRVPDLCLIIPDPLHQVSYPTSILVVAHHVTFTTYTSRDKQTHFSKPNNSIWVSSTKIRGIQIQTRTSQLLIRHINQGTNHLVSQYS
jgi:hypothetical protein